MTLSHENKEVMSFIVRPWGRESHEGSCIWGNMGRTWMLQTQGFEASISIKTRPILFFYFYTFLSSFKRSHTFAEKISAKAGASTDREVLRQKW